MQKILDIIDVVKADQELQLKFNNLLASKPADLESELLEFARELGYEVSREELASYFHSEKEKEKETTALSDEELDQVAGGKATSGTEMIVRSVVTIGLYCAIMSVASEVIVKQGSCAPLFDS